MFVNSLPKKILYARRKLDEVGQFVGSRLRLLSDHYRLYHFETRLQFTESLRDRSLRLDPKSGMFCVIRDKVASLSARDSEFIAL